MARPAIPAAGITLPLGHLFSARSPCPYGPRLVWWRRSDRRAWPVKGLAGQFWRTNETRQGSILFRLLAGGERCTSINRPRSSAKRWNSRCHARAVAATPRPGTGGEWRSLGRPPHRDRTPAVRPVHAGHKILGIRECRRPHGNGSRDCQRFKSDLRQHLRLLAGKSFANAQIAGQILSESLNDSLRSIRSRSGE